MTCVRTKVCVHMPVFPDTNNKPLISFVEINVTTAINGRDGSRGVIPFNFL